MNGINTSGFPPELLNQIAQASSSGPPWFQTLVLLFFTTMTLWMGISKFLDNRRSESSEVGRVTKDLEYTQRRLAEAREETDAEKQKRESAEARVQSLIDTITEIREQFAQATTEVRFLREDVVEARKAVEALTQENRHLRDQINAILRGEVNG